MPLTEPAGVYRPRHPERTVVYRLFEEHFERYVREYEERYEPREGSLRKVVPTAVEAYLACGRLEGGFARIRCPNCRAEHLLAFSCRTRNFCPSCQAKRSALFAEHVITEILEPVPHRHVVFTIPRVLRGLFQRERRLLGLLARAARDAIVPSVRAILDRHDATPGLVVSIQTFGSYAANFHPHVHVLLTDGAFTEEGEFLQLPYFDARLVEEVFRRRVLQRLHRAERLSEEFLNSLLGWVHSGFSVHGEQTVPTEDVQGAERLARYLTRGPLPIDVVEKVEGGRLRVRTPPDPRTGLVEKILDPLDLIHALTTQIPDPGQHMVRYYGWYSNRSRGTRDAVGARLAGPQPHPQPIPSPSRASWARLLKRIFEVDPLVCPACGSKMKIVSVITEPNVIDAILRHLARTGRRDPFEGRAPPAA